MADQHQEFEELIQAGELGTAETRLFAWIRDHPNDARAWLLYGKCISNPSQKRDCFKRALALDPSNAEAQELLKELEAPVPSAASTMDHPVRNLASPLNPSVPSVTFQKPSARVPKSPLISDRTKIRLSFVLYSILHFLLTILLGVALVYASSLLVPGLLNIEKTNDTIQRNWLSSSEPSSVDPELQSLANIFLNPSRLDYRKVNNLQELKQLRTSITIDPSTPDKRIDFSGVRFVGQLVGGTVLQSGNQGQPFVVTMDVIFDEAHIPLVYYGPVDNFHHEDMLLIEGVYIAEANGIAAQRVQQISTKVPTQAAEDTMTVLRVSAAVFLWALLCASVFVWKLNFKRWSEANAASLSTSSVLLVVIAWSIFLTGCTIDLSTTLRTDGTGITTMMAHESRENMDFLRSAPGISGYLSALVRDLKTSGTMFEQYIEGDQEVFLLQRYFNNSGGVSGNSYPIEGSWVSVQRYSEGNEEVIRFMGMVDTRTLYDNSDQLSSDVGTVLRDQLNQISMTYHLNVPGRLVYHNGIAVTKQQVSWKLQMNEPNFLVAETRFPGEKKLISVTYQLYIWIALGVIFVISTVFLIAGLRLRQGSKQAARQV